MTSTSKTSLRVQGMSCGHCVKTITHAIKTLDPSASVAVDLPTGRVSIDSVKSANELAAAINALDYHVVPE